MKTYTLGDEVVFVARFADQATNTPADPTSVRLRLINPFGIEIDPEVRHPRTGVFDAVYTPQSAGVWSRRWEGIGAVQAADEDKFEVKPTQFS